ncbi:YrhA family protein [Pseudomonas eucalypticola]|uniref:SMI1/KNR4 family protein n=1 Tax=Pseudomonas eucalypticola TaxID=2599595 RepID=A0A7D5HAE8_9PSED|nr:hypothetical protein HWQ56_00825 [Pseudomonas eucalypticola]
MDFLQRHNGVAGNGVFVYSSQKTLLPDGSGYNNGFIEVNLGYRDLDWMKNFLVLGDSDQDVYVLDLDLKVYQVRDRQAFDNIFETFNGFDELLVWVYQFILGGVDE